MAFSATSAMILVGIAILILSPSAAAEPSWTVYDVLKVFYLPVGILPKGVKSYTLDEATGEFHVAFETPCSFTVRENKITYEPEISGYISDYTISELTGVSVQRSYLLGQLDIKGLHHYGDDIEFRLNYGSESFSVESFRKSLHCQ